MNLQFRARHLAAPLLGLLLAIFATPSGSGQLAVRDPEVWEGLIDKVAAYRITIFHDNTVQVDERDLIDQGDGPLCVWHGRLEEGRILTVSHEGGGHANWEISRGETFGVLILQTGFAHVRLWRQPGSRR